MISKVDFAINDADAIKYYLLNVFGYKESNILYYRNATLLDLYSVFGKENNHRGKLNSWVEASSVKPDVFVYYSGHGAPDVQSGSAYLVPVDCDSPDRISVNGYSINVLYDNLSKLPYNTLTVCGGCWVGGGWVFVGGGGGGGVFCGIFFWGGWGGGGRGSACNFRKRV